MTLLEKLKYEKHLVIHPKFSPPSLPHEPAAATNPLSG